MIVKYDQFIKKSFNFEKRFFLFYGVNFGRIDNCVQTLKKRYSESKKNIKYLKYYQDDISLHGFNEIILKNNQDDIFGKKALLIFSLSDLKVSNEIVKLISSNNFNSEGLVIKCGPIQKNLKIRKFFEESDICICVPCYEETLNEKKVYIKKFFSHYKLDINDNETDDLAVNLSNERLSLQNDLKKILIFAQANQVNIRESYKLISSNQPEDLTKLTFLLASKNKEEFWKEFLKVEKFYNDEIKFISYFSNHLEKLIFVKEKILSGLTAYSAMKLLKPPIFFKHENTFLKQIEIWSENELIKTIKKLYFCQTSIIENKKSSRFLFLSTILQIFNKYHQAT